MLYLKALVPKVVEHTKSHACPFEHALLSCWRMAASSMRGGDHPETLLLHSVDFVLPARITASMNPSASSSTTWHYARPRIDKSWTRQATTTPTPGVCRLEKESSIIIRLSDTDLLCVSAAHRTNSRRHKRVAKGGPKPATMSQGGALSFRLSQKSGGALDPAEVRVQVRVNRAGYWTVYAHLISVSNMGGVPGQQQQQRIRVVAGGKAEEVYFAARGSVKRESRLSKGKKGASSVATLVVATKKAGTRRGVSASATTAAAAATSSSVASSAASSKALGAATVKRAARAGAAMADASSSSAEEPPAPREKTRRNVNAEKVRFRVVLFATTAEDTRAKEAVAPAASSIPPSLLFVDRLNANPGGALAHSGGGLIGVAGVASASSSSASSIFAGVVAGGVAAPRSGLTMQQQIGLRQQQQQFLRAMHLQMQAQAQAQLQMQAQMKMQMLAHMHVQHQAAVNGGGAARSTPSSEESATKRQRIAGGPSVASNSAFARRPLGANRGEMAAMSYAISQQQQQQQQQQRASQQQVQQLVQSQAQAHAQARAQYAAMMQAGSRAPAGCPVALCPAAGRHDFAFPPLDRANAGSGLVGVAAPGVGFPVAPPTTSVDYLAAAAAAASAAAAALDPTDATIATATTTETTVAAKPTVVAAVVNGARSSASSGSVSRCPFAPFAATPTA